MLTFLQKILIFSKSSTPRFTLRSRINIDRITNIIPRPLQRLQLCFPYPPIPSHPLLPIARENPNPISLALPALHRLASLSTRSLLPLQAPLLLPSCRAESGNPIRSRPRGSGKNRGAGPRVQLRAGANKDAGLVLARAPHGR